MAVDEARLDARGRPIEPALEPDLPIIDPHHHLWGTSFAVRLGKTLDDDDLTGFDRQSLAVPRYLLDDLLLDLRSGHNIVATVFAQCHAMYNADATEAMAPVGEVEFVNGIAAMSASGWYGPGRICAGIVGHADLLLGAAVAPVLEAQILVGGGRFKGIRHTSAWDHDVRILGTLSHGRPGLLLDAEFRRGFATLAPLGLSFDAWLLEPQLPDLVDLARTFPDTEIVLDHLGTPLGIGVYSDTREQFFPRWEANILALAELDNVVVKVGGLGMECLGFGTVPTRQPRSSAQLAEQWRPYIETAIEAFGPDRCMFESNYPVDGGMASYATLWNVYKRIVSGASTTDKTKLFAGTAERVYRLSLPR